jgi:hypothetical protein
VGLEGNRKIGARLARSYPFHPWDLFPWPQYTSLRKTNYFAGKLLHQTKNTLYTDLYVHENGWNKNSTVLSSTMKTNEYIWNLTTKLHFPNTGG